jgi:hypothetical protein
VVTKQPRLGPGRFQWNTGGWFGAQLGSTIWLLGATAILLPKYAGAGAVALFCFLAPNVFGLILYLNRSRIAPYPAIQWLIFGIGSASVIFVVYLNRSNLVGEIDPALSYGQWGFYLLLVMFAGLMALFHILERKAVNRRHETA